MDKDIREARNKAIDSLAVAIGFWGIDPLEARLYGLLFLSPRPLCIHELSGALSNPSDDVVKKLKVLERLGAVKEMTSEEGECDVYYEAEADFFEILQTVIKERQERDMAAAIQEISDQKAYVDWKYDEGNDPELKFLAERLGKLEKFIGMIDKAMLGLKALAGIRGMFRR